MSRFTLDFRESKPQFLSPPILLNHGRDNPHYEKKEVPETELVEVPETSEAVLMIHNIIRGAHSFWL